MGVTYIIAIVAAVVPHKGKKSRAYALLFLR